jgi:glycosyltransferase involved in cell wall biosynthesis
MLPKRTANISVVVIGWNEEKLVRLCFDSLCNQTVKPLEVFFIDGKSTDNTIKIVSEYKKKLPLTIVIQKNTGIGDAREQGFRLTKGSIIASTDADIVVPPNWLEKIENAFKQSKYAGVVGPYNFHHHPNFPNQLWLNGCRLGDYSQVLIAGFVGFRGMNFAIRRQVWKDTGGFNRNISALEDVDLASRTVKYGKIKYDPSLVVQTTNRRFRKNVFQSTMYRFGAYFYRIFMKSDKKFREWVQIRD